MKLKLYCALTALLTVSGCGTINTVMRGDDVVKRNMDKVDTKCSAIPRIYSGVVYDFCLLHAKPLPEGQWSSSTNDITLIGLDLVFSCVLDTLVLPYGIYKQVNDGSIRVK